MDLWCESLVPEDLGHVQVPQRLFDLGPRLSHHQITSGHNLILTLDSCVACTPHALHLLPVSSPFLEFCFSKSISSGFFDEEHSRKAAFAALFCCYSFKEVWDDHGGADHPKTRRQSSRGLFVFVLLSSTYDPYSGCAEL